MIVDLVSENKDGSEFSLHLIEGDPWDDTEMPTKLRRIQDRIYDAIDIALDGKLAQKYPDSKGKLVNIVVRLQGKYPRQAVELVTGLNKLIISSGEYQAEIAKSSFVSGILISCKG